jgi:branched-chain amino acid transport system substrate-binding protein
MKATNPSAGRRPLSVMLSYWLYVLRFLLLVPVVAACGAPATTAPTQSPPTIAPAQPVATQPSAPTAATQPNTAASGEPIFFFAPVELSGSGATPATNWRDGMLLAIEDINGAGGILGRPVEVEFADTQSDPPTSKAVIAKGLEKKPYAIMGPLASGNIIVNMTEAQRAEIPQIVGGEAANLTQQGNEYIFRTSFGQTTSMPKIANHLKASGIQSIDIISISNDFGKGGHDAIAKELQAGNIKIVSDLVVKPGQQDFSPEALTVLGSDAQAVFIYMNEEESARLLIELQKQGFEKPIFGETVLIAQSVIDLSKGAANGAQGHVGLTGSAPMPLVQEFAKRFQEKYGRVTDHNGIKGYIALFIVKEITERMGAFDSKRLAQELHCTKITTAQEPGVLIDIVYDDKGNVDRESFLVEVADNKQVVKEVLPRLGTTCGENK